MEPDVQLAFEKSKGEVALLRAETEHSRLGVERLDADVRYCKERVDELSGTAKIAKALLVFSGVLALGGVGLLGRFYHQLEAARAELKQYADPSGALSATLKGMEDQTVRNTTTRLSLPGIISGIAADAESRLRDTIEFGEVAFSDLPRPEQWTEQPDHEYETDKVVPFKRAFTFIPNVHVALQGWDSRSQRYLKLDGMAMDTKGFLLRVRSDKRPTASLRGLSILYVAYIESPR